MARNALIQIRRDTAANWTSTNPTLAAGEMGFETDTGKLKIGTGSTAWTSLLYSTDASDITGATLASNVVSSSLTSVGTLGSLAVTGATTSGSFVQGTDYLSPYQGFRNKIINGDFSIWQRNATASFSSTPFIGAADRWYHFSNVSFGRAEARRETLPPGTIPGYDAQYLLLSLNYDSQPNVFSQRIEDVRTLAGQTVTLSFWVNNFSTGNNTISSSLTQNFGTGGSTSVGTNFSNVATTSGWSRVSRTLTLPSISGKTVGANSYLQLTLNTNTHYFVGIAGVQLEQGSVATPFEQRPLGVELALCQRYYYSSGTVVNAYMSMHSNQFGEIISFAYPTTMRATPTLTNSFTNNDNTVLVNTYTTDKYNSIRVYPFNTGFEYGSFTYSFTVSAEL